MWAREKQGVIRQCVEVEVRVVAMIRRWYVDSSPEDRTGDDAATARCSAVRCSAGKVGLAVALDEQAHLGMRLAACWRFGRHVIAGGDTVNTRCSVPKQREG